MSYSRCLSLSALLASTFITPVTAMDLTLVSSDNNAILEYTHTNTPIPKPASSFADMSRSYQTAGICFLGVGDCDPGAGFSRGDDYSVDTEVQCLNAGYTKQNCNSLQTIDTPCPYNAAYGKGCKCASNLVSCPDGQVGVGESCDEMYASCECDPTLVSCASNQVGQGASCGGKHQSCVCKSEYIYSGTNCTSPRSVSGASCDGKYTGCVCPSGVSSGSYGCEEYYGSPCSSVCKKAYADNCHIRSDDPNTALGYGCMKYYDDCSTKCERAYTDNCRNRTAVISSCPANATCSYFSDCSSKIQSWSCKSGYKQEGSSCVVASETCKIGSIYYTDGTCFSAANHQTNKTVLGIVVHITDGGKHGQVMAPWPIDANGNKTSSNSTRMTWSTEYVDISSLPNHTNGSASKDYDSCGNTDKIVAQGNASTYPAAWAARKYAPTEATKGKWCLPAAGIMTNIYNYRGAIQTAISKVGGVSYPECCTWSSSEYSGNIVWYSHLGGGYGLTANLKDSYGPLYVRPVLAF